MISILGGDFEREGGAKGEEGDSDWKRFAIESEATAIYN